jgi:HEPN domain-containing protein
MAEAREIRQQELARLLLQKANQDLALVETVQAIQEIADEIVGFHVQQAIEKAIKAVLTRLGVAYEYTHDLSLLYQQVEDAFVDPPAPRDAVEEMTFFAVQFRYTLFEEQDFDREAGVWLAKKFVHWARDVVESPTLPATGHGQQEPL